MVVFCSLVNTVDASQDQAMQAGRPIRAVNAVSGSDIATKSEAAIVEVVEAVLAIVRMDSLRSLG